MATTPTTPSNTAKTLLDTLSEAGGYVGLAVQLGEVLVPLGVALVNKIKGIGTGQATETYQLLVAGDQTELQNVISGSNADLAAINAELTRLGKPPLAVTAPAPTAGS